MKTCDYAGAALSEVRSHPWSVGLEDPRARYLDLTAQPELIRSALEDFTPFARYPAIELFYALLERINHPKSALESSDCAFSGPAQSDSPRAGSRLECAGRVVLFYRELSLNTLKSRVSWLKTAFHYQLAHLDAKFDGGLIGTTLVPARYLALPAEAQLGEQLMLSFWAFGSDEDTTMQNLSRLLTNLTRALRGVSARIVQDG